MRDFVLTRAARGDLLDIGRFTASRWGKAQRNAYLARLDDAFHQLAENPELGPDCSNIRPGIRKFPIGSHVVYYRRTGTGVRIVRILHKRMDVASSFGQPR